MEISRLCCIFEGTKKDVVIISELHLHSIEQILGKDNLGVMWQSLNIYDPITERNSIVHNIRLERDYSTSLSDASPIFLLTYDYGQPEVTYKWMITYGVSIGDTSTARAILRAIWDDHKLRDKLAELNCDKESTNELDHIL